MVVSFVLTQKILHGRHAACYYGSGCPTDHPLSAATLATGRVGCAIPCLFPVGSMRLLTVPKLGDDSDTALAVGSAPPVEGCVEQLTHPQAIELLDWLERHGVTKREFQV